jgi:hypothetical protein
MPVRHGSGGSTAAVTTPRPIAAVPAIAAAPTAVANISFARLLFMIVDPFCARGPLWARSQVRATTTAQSDSFRVRECDRDLHQATFKIILQIAPSSFSIRPAE